MIKFNSASLASGPAAIKPLNYVRNDKGIRRIVLPFTRWMRAVNAEKYIGAPAERHLDIGCGDGYFLLRSKCAERIGLDKIYGDEVSDTLDFPDDYFDYVTMLAVLDLLDEPKVMLAEIARVLKPTGRLIVTSPKPSAHRLIHSYMGQYQEDERYINLARMKELAGTRLDIVGYHVFLFGFNQAFCLMRPDGQRP